MNPLGAIRLLPGVILATLATVATADPPNWDPRAVDTVPFENVDLASAQSVLYLDNACSVVAFIVPKTDELGTYLPKLGLVKKRWWERAEIYRHPAKDPCPSKSTFLDAELVSGANAKACQPNELVSAADLTDVICRIKHDKITSVIVLDPFHEPVLILEGKLAYTTARDTVPATNLGRAKFLVGAPCSPTTPSPCYPPKQGVLKTINGQQVCVCQ